jgi:hypothetical protein
MYIGETGLYNSVVFQGQYLDDRRPFHIASMVLSSDKQYGHVYVRARSLELLDTDSV